MNENPIKKILILAANPIDSVRLSLEREVSEIRTTLQLSKNRDRFEIAARGSVRPNELQQYLYDLQPQIVHFSGHGLGSLIADNEQLSSRKFTPILDDDLQPQGLMFEDDNGRSKVVSGVALANLFDLFRDQVVCVVLNACYSAQQAQEIVKYIPYVVGMNRAIGDLAARKFSQGFYRAIWDNRSIEEAFLSGKNAIELDGIPEDLTPVLLKRDLPKAGQSESPDISIVENSGSFYIVRTRLEKRCYEEIIKPGMLIRIKSPDKMGKSFMMSRVLDYVEQNGYRTAIIDLREANQEIFADINLFLKWLCAMVGDRLNIDRDPEENWKKFLGANPNCTKFFENYFLSTTDRPLVIAFDNFDCIFDHANIETDFCGLLRGWFEKVNTNKVWGNLRQIIVYSQESYAIKDINQSPFNVGLSIELGELDSRELLAFANAYGLSWTNQEIEKLMHLIGGHPYLAKRAFDRITHQEKTLDELLRTAPTEEGIYGDFLTERLQYLEENLLLVESMRKVVNSDRPVRLGSKETFKLDSMGLIKRQGSDVLSRSNLYRLYFKDRLRE
jgi:AAA-like domain/CHAT domain